MAQRKYRLGKNLGKGTFGIVRLALNEVTKQKVAIKILKTSKLKTEKEIQRVKTEVAISQKLSHPNIIKTHDVFEEGGKLYIVMENCAGGDLHDFIRKHKKLSEHKARKLYKQLLAGIEYLKSKQVVHRDIKPENLLFDKHMNLKICDFGLARSFSKLQRLGTACGSPCYAAPEILTGETYSPNGVDLWSSGIVLFQMLTGELPYSDRDPNELYPKIRKSNRTLPDIIPEYLSSECRDFLLKVLNTDPRRRYSITELRKHAWMTTSEEKEIRAFSPNVDRSEIRVRSLGRSSLEPRRDLKMPDFADAVAMQESKNKMPKIKPTSGKIPNSENASTDVTPEPIEKHPSFLPLHIRKELSKAPVSSNKVPKIKFNRNFELTIDSPDLNATVLFSKPHTRYLEPITHARMTPLNASLQDDSSVSGHDTTSIPSPCSRGGTCHTSLGGRVNRKGQFRNSLQPVRTHNRVRRHKLKLRKSRAPLKLKLNQTRYTPWVDNTEDFYPSSGLYL